MGAAYTIVHEVIPVGLSRSKHKETQVFMSYDTNPGQNHINKIANKSFKNWTKLKYLGLWQQIKIVLMQKLQAD